MPDDHRTAMSQVTAVDGQFGTHRLGRRSGRWRVVRTWLRCRRHFPRSSYRSTCSRSRNFGLAAQAHTAAREVRDPAAVAAARAAGHAAAVAHMASHALGAPAYAAKAAGLAAPNDPTATAGVVEWAHHHASPAVRDVLRRLPSRTQAGGTLGKVLIELQQRLNI